MPTLDVKVREFLAQPRIAVAGVSRTHEDAADLIYRRFKARGYRVFPVNPKAQTVEGDRCYPNLAAISGGVDGVVIVTRPQAADEIVRQCPAAGVRWVWRHRSMVRGGSSVRSDAVTFCDAKGINVIAGGCPLMHGKTSLDEQPGGGQEEHGQSDQARCGERRPTPSSSHETITGRSRWEPDVLQSGSSSRRSPWGLPCSR